MQIFTSREFYDESLEDGHPVTMLKTQYRMHIFTREREMKKQKVRWENVKKCWNLNQTSDSGCTNFKISKCVVVGILMGRMCRGKKISSGKWYYYPLAHLLFAIGKVKKKTKIFYSGLVGCGCLYMFFCFCFGWIVLSSV